MKFVKYHGLGNDYLVIEPEQFSNPPDPAQIRQVCDRHYGPGSDGILLGPLPTTLADFGLRIYNPDGSLAEKSGNGLRIFSRYLWDCQRLHRQGDHSLPFTVHTPGGVVRSQVFENGRVVHVEMGQASFDSQRVPVSGPAREVINESMLLEGREYGYCAVSMGNPHCVILYDLALQQDPHIEPLSEGLARRLGPLIENEPRFPQRTNVQFLQVIDRGNLRIEIWERGAGYTLASGSSSCAATAAAYRMGWCDSQITMHMPGGCLQISISPYLDLTMRGPVEKVFEGWIDEREETG
jgi:diaminopimelate epimerase